MTNKEKAKEIIFGWSDSVQEDAYDAALQMAEWKDQQFNEYLEKKKEDIEQGILHSNPQIDSDRWCGRADIINEIINELFGR